MNHLSKLKPSNPLEPFLLALFILAISAIAWGTFGRGTAVNLLAVTFFLMSSLSAYSCWKTGNRWYLVVFAFQFLTGLLISFLPGGFIGLGESRMTKSLAVLAAISYIPATYAIFSKKVMWRGREILELAAMPIEDISNGFTSRPRPSGKIDVHKESILSFAAFLSRQHVLYPYIDGEKVFFVTIKDWYRSYKHMLGFAGDISQDTWINIDFNGNLAVNISKKDYYMYKEDLSFDQLCASLANVFVEFLMLYEKDESIRIMDRLNALRIGPFE